MMQENRPHLQIIPGKGDRMLESMGWVMLAALWVFTIVSYFSLPATIPVHFNASGRPDGYSGKANFFILPVLGSVLFLALTQLNKYPWLFNYINLTRHNTQRQYTYGTKMIRSLKTSLVLVFLIINVFTWLTAKGIVAGIGNWFLPAFLALFLLPTLFYVARSLSQPKEH